MDGMEELISKKGRRNYTKGELAVEGGRTRTIRIRIRIHYTHTIKGGDLEIFRYGHAHD